MHTDASNNTIAAVLLQSDPDDPEDYHPVAYLSWKLSSAEKNYAIAEKETLAVIYALKNWRCICSSILKYSPTTRLLSICRASRTCRNVKLVGLSS